MQLCNLCGRLVFFCCHRLSKRRDTDRKDLANCTPFPGCGDGEGNTPPLNPPGVLEDRYDGLPKGGGGDDRWGFVGHSLLQRKSP